MELGIKPGAAGWEARMLPLCYAVSPITRTIFIKKFCEFEREMPKAENLGGTKLVFGYEAFSILTQPNLSKWVNDLEFGHVTQILDELRSVNGKCENIATSLTFIEGHLMINPFGTICVLGDVRSKVEINRFWRALLTLLKRLQRWCPDPIPSMI